MKPATSLRRGLVAVAFLVLALAPRAEPRLGADRASARLQAGAYSAESAAPSPSPAKPGNDGSAAPSWAVVVVEQWTPPEGQPAIPECLSEKPADPFIQPLDPPPRS
jgi:hypothetical protein